MTWLDDTVAADHTFACCLSHDVDRPFKTYQALARTVTDRDPRQLLDLLPQRNPYWTFEAVVEIERDLGVRSSWYFLDEQSLFADRPVREWVDPRAWLLYAGRYDLDDERFHDLIGTLDDGGWEVGLHGSYESYRSRAMLADEKAHLESILGRAVSGVRQHYLNLDRPDTWARQRSVGLEYDASPGSAKQLGFQEGYEPLRPFDDDFLVFPVTIMDASLPPLDDFESVWQQCESILAEARENRAVMTLLWHPRYFSDDHPGYSRLYRRLVRRAQELGAWVGPIGELYGLDHPVWPSQPAAVRECEREPER